MITIIQEHTNLANAIAVLGLCAWAFLTDHLIYIIGLMFVGAFAYYVSGVFGFIMSLALSVWTVQVSNWTEYGATLAMLEFVGYALSLRLGLQHRREQELLQQAQLGHHGHRDHVMPWQVSNDIRTSLAAVRFLLFPVHEGEHHQAVEEAVKELSRLENLFQTIESQNDDADSDREAIGSNRHIH